MCSVVLRPAVKPACSRRRCLWKVGLMRSKRIIANSFPGMESRVMPRWFVSFVLPKGENDSPSPIIGDGFHEPYTVDYVRQPVNN